MDNKGILGSAWNMRILLFDKLLVEKWPGRGWKGHQSDACKDYPTGMIKERDDQERDDQRKWVPFTAGAWRLTRQQGLRWAQC